jgi:uncharacterized protein YggE
MTLNAAAPRPPTTINIHGRATAKAIAERASLDIHISDSGFDKDVVSRDVVGAVNAVQTDVDKLCSRLENGDMSPSSPITFYSIAALSVSTGEFFDEEKQAFDPKRKLFTAESTLTIQFRDFSVLGDLVVRMSTMKSVGLRGLEWQLTDAKKAWLDEEVRLQALQNAIERAGAYARLIGREKVNCVKIEDLDESWPVVGYMRQAAPKAASVEAFAVGAGIQFEPGNVEVSGGVKVEFLAE